MSNLNTNSQKLVISQGPGQRSEQITTNVVNDTVEISTRDDTDHTIVMLTPLQARQLALTLIEQAAYADGNVVKLARPGVQG